MKKIKPVKKIELKRSIKIILPEQILIGSLKKRYEKGQWIRKTKHNGKAVRDATHHNITYTQLRLFALFKIYFVYLRQAYNRYVVDVFPQLRIAEPLECMALDVLY